MGECLDVVALGELLIDFTENGISNQGNPLMEANPGGAPCNVLSMLTRLGRKVAFIGKVGNDGFGKQLENAIEQQGIITSGLVKDEQVNTTLAIVLKLPNGDRDFAFYRKPGADMMLEENEINYELIKNARLFHFGSLSLTDQPVRNATKKAVEVAKANGLLISFDPNLREPLWSSLMEAKQQIDWGLQQCDILKISDNEIQWFTGKNDFDEGIEILRNEYPNIKFICLSMGSDGSQAYYKDLKIHQPAFIQAGPIETTGCGDTFCGCMLHFILEHGIDNFDEDKIQAMLEFANGAASLISKKKGALRVMPYKEDVLYFIESRKEK